MTSEKKQKQIRGSLGGGGARQGWPHSEWGKQTRGEAGSRKAGSTQAQQHGDTPTLENTGNTGLMVEEGGFEFCGKTIGHTTAQNSRALRGPPRRSGPRPAFSTTPCAGRGSASGEGPRRRARRACLSMCRLPRDQASRCATSFYHRRPIPAISASAAQGGPQPRAPWARRTPSLASGSRAPPGFRGWPGAALRHPAPSTLQRAQAAQGAGLARLLPGWRRREP